MRLIKTPSIPFTPPKCLWKEKIQGDYIELLWSTTWSSKVGLRVWMGSTVWKCCDVPMAKPFIHPPLPCFFTLFLSPFFCFSWARVYDAGGEHPGVLAARLPGTQASTMAVRGGAMTQQDTGPDFDTVALLLFCVLWRLRSGSRRPPRRWVVPLASCRTGLSNWQPSCCCKTTE